MGAHRGGGFPSRLTPTPVYRRLMPTIRPRHLVTETDELAEALDAAAQRWPELSRGQLVARLALEGHRAAIAEHHRRREERVAMLRGHTGALTGVYDEGYREHLRTEWPA